MAWHMIMKAVWPIALLFFLGISVAQISERLKHKSPNMAAVRPHGATLVEQSAPPGVTRTDALLGGACVLLAAFWGFDVMLSWALKATS